MPQTPEKLFSSIEIGTNSIKVLIAMAQPDGTFQILGSGTGTSVMVMKGEIKDVQIVGEALNTAIQKAEKEADVDIRSTFIGLAVSGAYISTAVEEATITIGDSRPITQDDTELAIHNARNKDISSKYCVLGTSAKYYTLDDEQIFLNPIGQKSQNLMVSLLIFKALKQRLSTPFTVIMNVLNRQNNDACYTPLALGKACLGPGSVTQDGQIIIDIGAGVTSFAVFTSSGCHTAKQITVGCNHAVNDLSIALELDFDYAKQILTNLDRIKCSVNPNEVHPIYQIEVAQGPGSAPKTIPSNFLEEIVTLRFQEIFEIINNELNNEKAWSFSNKSIMLSGGVVKIPGIFQLAQDVFKRPVIPAVPFGFTGPDEILNDPTWITPLGTLRKAKETLEIYNHQNPDPDADTQLKGGKFQSILRNILNF